MSRVGKQPVPIPDGVSVEHKDGAVRVKGPKGALSQRIPETIGVQIGDGQVTLLRSDDRKQSRALHGLTRALVANMVQLDGADSLSRGLTQDDTVLAILPFFHIYGLLVIMNWALSHGARIVVLPRFELETIYILT